MRKASLAMGEHLKNDCQSFSSIQTEDYQPFPTVPSALLRFTAEFGMGRKARDLCLTLMVPHKF